MTYLPTEASRDEREREREKEKERERGRRDIPKKPSVRLLIGIFFTSHLIQLRMIFTASSSKYIGLLLK